MEIFLKVSGKQLQIETVETTDKEVVSLSNTLEYQLKESVITDDFNSIKDITAYTLVLKNGKYKKIKSKDYTTEDYVSRGVFYSDTKRSVITFSGAVEGSILHSEVKLEHRIPQLIPPFYFDHYLECDTSEFVVILDEGVEMNFIDKFFGFEGNIKKTVEKVDRKTIHRWVGTGFPERDYEEGTGNVSCYSPHIIPHITTYIVDGEQHNILRHKEDLFAWYSGLIKDQELSEEHTPILDSIKSNSSSNLQLAENIFNWVQHNVKYIAYEDGLGGFVPRTPNSVIKNRFGDCKDMAMLTKTMMNKCGLDCYIAWVGTRDKCYTYDGCPTPVTDNHMIAAYPSEDGIVFIDPTSTYSEFGVPSSFIQGKEAMVRIDDQSFEIITVPFVNASDNRSSDVFNLGLDGNVVFGSGKNTVSGYAKIDYEYDIAYKTVSLEELFAVRNEVGNNSFSVSEFKQENTNSNKGEIKTEYNFALKNYVSEYNGSIYFSPFLKKVIDFDFTDRTLDLNIDYKFENSVVVSMKLGEKEVINSSIVSEVIEENGFKLEIKNRSTSDEFRIEYRFTCNRSNVRVEEFEEVKETLKKMNKKLKQQIEFKRID